MQTVRFHPAILRPLYRRYILLLLLIAASGFFWGLSLFIASLALPNLFVSDLQIFPFSVVSPSVRIIYSWCSMLHALYVALTVLLAHLLASRRWLRVSAFAALLPGPGLLFSLLQIPIALIIFYRLKQALWQDFFSLSFPAWNTNDLTIDKSEKLLYHRGSSSDG